MLDLVVGSILLSILHALIPNHWIPLVAIGRTQRWSHGETLGFTVLCGFAHTLSTILIGVAIGFLGYSLSRWDTFITTLVAPSILVLLGVVFLVLGLRHGHHHHHHGPDPETARGRGKGWIVFSLCVAMFFSPCLEIEAYYFTAGGHGWAGIGILSAAYLLLTVLGMVVLVHFGLKGVERFNFHFLEHHEKTIVGVLLVVLGIAAYFVH